MELHLAITLVLNIHRITDVML